VCEISDKNSLQLLRKWQNILGDTSFAAHCSFTFSSNKLLKNCSVGQKHSGKKFSINNWNCRSGIQKWDPLKNCENVFKCDDGITLCRRSVSWVSLFAGMIHEDLADVISTMSYHVLEIVQADAMFFVDSRVVFSWHFCRIFFAIFRPCWCAVKPYSPFSLWSSFSAHLFSQFILTVYWWPNCSPNFTGLS